MREVTIKKISFFSNEFKKNTASLSDLICFLLIMFAVFE